MGQAKVKFKGFDWTELYKPLVNKPLKNSDDEKVVAIAIKEAIGVVAHTNSKDEARVAKCVRRFLETLADQEEKLGYLAPYYRGISAIEHNGSMLNIVSLNLELLWT